MSAVACTACDKVITLPEPFRTIGKPMMFKLKFVLVLTCAAFFAAASTVTAAPLKVTERQILEQKPSHDIDFKYPETGIPAIDKPINDWIQDTLRDFQEGRSEVQLEPGQSYSGEISYEIGRNDGTMFSVLFTYYSFTGGAHPNSYFTTFNFLLPDGVQVEIGDLFSRDGIVRISKISIAQLHKDLIEPNGGGDTDWIARGAAPIGKNFQNFILKPNELDINFDSYQVAPYAAGPQEVHIPLGQLRTFLRPDPRAPAPSFDCAKAASDVEHAICSSRELAQMDRRVADEYFDALGWAADEAAKTKLKTGQKAWLNERDTHCRVAAQSMQSCLMTSYQARLKALRNRT